MLHFAGAATPDRGALVKEIRKKTGRPESEGTNAQNIMDAMQAIAPWIPIKTRRWDTDKLMRALQKGRIAASIGTDYHDLPTRLRRWSPATIGGHQIGLANAKQDRKRRWRVHWVDPLGTGGYKGEWVLWDDVKDAVHGSGGRVDATTLEKEAAVRLQQRQLEAFGQPTDVKVQSGTRVYAIGKKSMALEPDRRVKKDRKFKVDGLWRIEQQPGWLPTGKFYRLAATGNKQEFVRVSKAELIETEVEVLEDPEDFEDGTDEADVTRDDATITAVVDADVGDDPAVAEIE